MNQPLDRHFVPAFFTLRCLSSSMRETMSFISPTLGTPKFGVILVSGQHHGRRLVFEITSVCSRAADRGLAMLAGMCEHPIMCRPTRNPTHGRLRSGIRRKASRLKALPALFGSCISRGSATLQSCHTTSRWAKYRFQLGPQYIPLQLRL